MMAEIQLQTSVIPSDFQLEVLSYLIRDREVMSRFIEAVREENFENPIHRVIYRLARAYFIQYLKTCPKSVLEREIASFIKQNRRQVVAPPDMFWHELERAYNTQVGERDYVVDRINTYVLRAQVAELSEVAQHTVRQENMSMEALARSINSLFLTITGRRVTDRSELLLGDAEARTREDPVVSKIPTGWRNCDQVLGGGLGKGELGVIMAPTGFGKSFALIAIGAHCLRTQRRVLHLTFELAKDRVLNRYEALLTAIPKESLHTHSPRVREMLRRMRRLVTPGDVLVMEYPMKSLSVDELRAVVTQIRIVREFDPDLLVVDYADIMKPLPHSREERRDVILALTYEKLRALAQEFGIPVWTGSQANKRSASKEIITVADISESFAKAQIADVVIALCRTPTELETHRGRFYFTKVRESRGHIVIPFRETFDISKIEEMDQATPQEVPATAVDYSEGSDSPNDDIPF